MANVTPPTEQTFQTEHIAQSPPVTFAYAKLPAQDVDRARKFWAETFGLNPFRERYKHLYYEAGTAHFLVFPSTGAPSGTHDQLGLIVDDLETQVLKLRSSGVKLADFPPPPDATVVNGIVDRGYMKVVWFRDSEGNLISMAEFKEGNPFQR